MRYNMWHEESNFVFFDIIGGGTGRMWKKIKLGTPDAGISTQLSGVLK